MSSEARLRSFQHTLDTAVQDVDLIYGQKSMRVPLLFPNTACGSDLICGGTPVSLDINGYAGYASFK